MLQQQTTLTPQWLKAIKVYLLLIFCVHHEQMGEGKMGAEPLLHFTLNQIYRLTETPLWLEVLADGGGDRESYSSSSIHFNITPFIY